MEAGEAMRLVIKQNDHTINEVRFTEGPISIGREANSQVLLPDGAVSKRHAVIFITEDGKWMVEDLDSTNQTYLNDEAIHKAEIKTGDSLSIADFTIEINLEDDTDTSEPARMEDTFRLEAALATPPHEIVVRRPDASHAPAMRLPSKRLTDFSRATEAICKADSLEELLSTLLDITLRQFTAYHAWCGLREQPTGPMTYQSGKRRDGRAVELSEIVLSDKINETIERGQSLVLPRVAAQIEEKERIRSAIIASVMRHAGCFGVLYVDNAMVHEHYSLSDLDYMMLLAIDTSAVLKNLLNL
jgi:pSer/pThr/pTyr-binding forkhead associated (FHA) protein